MSYISKSQLVFIYSFKKIHSNNCQKYEVIKIWPKKGKSF